MNHLQISNYYSDFLDSFLYVDNIEDLDLSKYEISKTIYKHIFKIKAAQWKYKILFKRRKNNAISDLFQDIIALYLLLALGSDFEIIVEENIKKIKPDILIRYKKKNLFIIEIKTTIGWERGMCNNGVMEHRIKKLSEAANIPKDNIIYIFMSPWNVSKEFANIFWDSQNDKPRKPMTEYPFNKIRPLLTGEDPFYWKQYKGIRDEKYIEFADSEINRFAESGIVVPIELTIDEIKKVASIADTEVG